MISTIYCYRKDGKAQYPARKGWCPERGLSPRERNLMIVRRKP
jgi:hypothetical protein